MMRPSATLLAFFSAIALCFGLAAPAHALEVPKLAGHVNDHAGLLSASEAQTLEQKLARHEQSSGQQFALLIVRSLEGDPIEDFSIRVVEAWKLGKKGKDDGLLLLVASNDRKMRIEVGYGLEGVITDAVSSRVIRSTLAPAFREKRYAVGFNLAFDQLIQRAGGEASGAAAEPEERRARGAPPKAVRWITLLALIVFAPLLFLASRFGGGSRRFGRRYGGYIGGGSFGGGSWGGGGGFSGGGGGFSGGGGSFGGGGASGGW